MRGSLLERSAAPRRLIGRGEDVYIGEFGWIMVLPPAKPGLYAICFIATLDSGARLGARDRLTVIEVRGRP
jgi:hypothetical protein